MRYFKQNKIFFFLEPARGIPGDMEFDGKSTFYQIDAMLAGQSLGLKMINGYSATSPAGYYTFWREMNESSRKKWAVINNLKTEDIFVIH